MVERRREQLCDMIDRGERSKGSQRLRWRQRAYKGSVGQRSVVDESTPNGFEVTIDSGIDTASRVRLTTSRA